MRVTEATPPGNMFIKAVAEDPLFPAATKDVQNVPKDSILEILG